jgi:hypothetical protein
MKSRSMCFAPGRVIPGMALAAPVVAPDGHTLLVAGTVLDSEMIERLVRRGTETVWVLVVDTRDEATIAIELRAAEERVAQIFRAPGSAAREALRESVLAFRREQAK